MKVFFLIFHGFEDFSGITKKIRAQIAAFRANGAQTTLCYHRITPEGNQEMVLEDGTVIIDYGSGIAGKIRKRIDFMPIGDYVVREKFDMVYMRYDHNASPFLGAMLRKLKKAGIKVVMEIPTYPYDSEYTGYPLKFRMRLYTDRLFRRRMAREVYRIATFSDHAEIFGTRTINISNGIDFAQIPLKSAAAPHPGELRLLAVAQIHYWHGFDRLIRGLNEYYSKPHEVKVLFDIVGDGFFADTEPLHRLVEEGGTGEYVRFLGAKSGAGLDECFEWADMGVASLARHRSGITHLKSLKNREYAARGIPFVYSEIDTDFEAMPYIIKAPADESPIDIAKIVDFYFSHQFNPATIRASIEKTLSWNVQMHKILTETNLI